jgi:LysM repeat protein
MLRNYKLILSFVCLVISSLGVFSQSEVEYKDVILDGKPARLNVTTGEITVVKLVNEKKVEPSKTIEKSIPDKADVVNVSDFHIVKEGETLFKIANQCNTSLSELKDVNNLETTLVNEGQKLRIKNFDILTSDAVAKASDEPNNLNIHMVEKGQTLYSIAKRYNIKMSELKHNNNLNSNLIKEGQKLIVGNFDTTQKHNHSTIWIVSKGDTLYSIARENGVTIDVIKSLNGLKGNLILVGQKLQLK